MQNVNCNAQIGTDECQNRHRMNKRFMKNGSIQGCAGCCRHCLNRETCDICCVPVEMAMKYKSGAQNEPEKAGIVPTVSESPVVIDDEARQLAFMRTLPEIEADILLQQRTICGSIITIGRDLIEAKDMLDHGQWMEWLKTRVNFSKSTAENFMRIAREVSDGSPLAALPYTKVLPLLSLPAPDREEFAEQIGADDRSAAEIKRLVSEAKRAKTLAEQAQQREQVFSKYLDAEREKNAQLRDELREEREKKAQIEYVDRPVEPADYAVLRERAAQADALEARARQAEDDLIEAEERARLAEEEAQAAQMGQIDGQGASGSSEDALSVKNFCSVCTDFTSALFMAPYAAAYFAECSLDDKRRYKMLVDSVRAWVDGTQKALDAAMVTPMPYEGGDDYEVR